MQRRSWVVMVLVLALLAACSSIESGEISTESLRMRVRVASSATATDVEVAFRGPQANQVVTLAAGDEVSVSVLGGTPQALTVEQPNSVNARYVGALPAVAEGTVLVVSLTRATFQDAPDTRVTVPSAPVVTAPVAGPAATAVVTAAWEPFADDQVELRFRVDACADVEDDEEDAIQGLVALLSETYEGADGTGTIEWPFPAVACDADLLVGRFTGEVALDPALGAAHPTPSRIVRFAAPIALSFTP